MYCTRRSIVRLVARRQEHGLINTLAAVLPTAHVLDHFRFDLVLGQVEGIPARRDLPGRFQPVQVQFGQFHKVLRGGKRSVGQKQMQMRMPMQQLSVSLDGRDHAGDHAGTVAERWSATHQTSELVNLARLFPERTAAMIEAWEFWYAGTPAGKP